MSDMDFLTFNRPPCSFPWCGSISEEPHVVCEAGHSVEWSCFRGYLSTQLERQAMQILCPIDGCSAVVLASHLLPLMDKRQQELFSRINVKKALAEQCVECPSCPCVMWISEECYPLRKGQILTCNACKTHFCSRCVSLYDCHPQSDCDRCTGEMAKFKKQILSAVMEAHSVPCPVCQHRWVKNSQCTHMLCTKCENEFCYVCGKSLAELQVQDPSIQRLFDHNEGFPGKPNTCPMWIESLRDLYSDDRTVRQSRRLSAVKARKAIDQGLMPAESETDIICPSDPALALEWFHVQRATKALNQVKQQLGAERWAAVHRQWPGLLNDLPWAESIL